MVTSSSGITPFLTVSGRAEEAMTFYVSLFPRSEVIAIRRYGSGDGGVEGSVMHATFALDGREFMCSDSYVAHGWSFTPAISLYVACESAVEVERLYGSLSEGGQVFMPLGAYPFSEQFAWVGDRFGVTWQLALDHE